MLASRGLPFGAVFLLLLTSACGREATGEEAIPTRTISAEGRGSMPAIVTQRMGTTEISVVYNRPSARGRELFGTLVPWDSTWNPGASEATRIEVTEAVLVAGEPLPAGRYSIWAVPNPEEWTVRFNRGWEVWHLPVPHEGDALRIRVRPQPAGYMETLNFSFPVADTDSVLLALHWGETMVPIPIRRP